LSNGSDGTFPGDPVGYTEDEFDAFENVGDIGCIFGHCIGTFSILLMYRRRRARSGIVPAWCIMVPISYTVDIALSIIKVWKAVDKQIQVCPTLLWYFIRVVTHVFFFAT